MTTAVLLVAGCTGSSETTKPSGDDAFRQLTSELFAFIYQFDPSLATTLGIHTYDDRIQDRSAEAIQATSDTVSEFRARFDGVDSASLSPGAALDLDQTVHTLDSMLLDTNVIRSWTKDADLYSSGITNDAFVMISRAFAPPEERLRSLIQRMQLMPAVLDEARNNLDNPPRIYTEIAIEQIEGNRDFFAVDVPAAFGDVGDQALLAEFKTANDAVLGAFDDYGKWLATDLLPRSNGSFAWGADTYQQALAADQMITTPLPELLSIAEADLERNQRAFAETAAKIDPTKRPRDVLNDVKAGHPPAAELLQTTQDNLDSLVQFVRDKDLVDIPSAPPAKVVETPPFMRATTSASMDTPGPFETVATEAYFNMTLPDPSWTAQQQDEYMARWYPAAISNVSVHEVWPGHYLQFLYAKQFPSDVRKVFGVSSNFEGWAHYCEQMMLDEGLHADDPRYRLAQLQDAILRDVRFIAGIKLHTEGMTVEDATELFVTEAYQPRRVAESEAKRGTSDALYGYYTMGKLMILKLRDDYQAHMGDRYSLKTFHDEFVKMGPLALPLVRRAMLGETGELF